MKASKGTREQLSPSSISRIFHLAKLKLCPHCILNPQSPPQPPSPWLLPSTNVLSDSINLIVLGISYKWNLGLNQWKIVSQSVLQATLLHQIPLRVNRLLLNKFGKGGILHHHFHSLKIYTAYEHMGPTQWT